MSRDLKDLQKRYQILNNENDLYNNNDNMINNKNVGIKINAFSNIHRNHVNQVKNNFYKKNGNLKYFSDDNKAISNKGNNNKINNANSDGKFH